MDKLDPRLGYIADTEHVTFPALNLAGLPYTRPVSTLNIGQGYFVALDTVAPPDEAAIAELKALVAPMAALKVTARKASSDEPAT